MPTALESISQERQRQIDKLGWNAQHDDRYTLGQLAKAAACYTLRPYHKLICEQFWPWDINWWKPKPEDRRRELVKAAALLVAEIDRIDREALKK